MFPGQQRSVPINSAASIIGIYGHLTLRDLAVLAEEQGDQAKARRLWRMILDACPGDPEATSRIGA